MEEEVGGSRTRQKENVQMFGDAPENNVLRREKTEQKRQKGEKMEKGKHILGECRLQLLTPLGGAPRPDAAWFEAIGCGLEVVLPFQSARDQGTERI